MSFLVKKTLTCKHVNLFCLLFFCCFFCLFWCFFWHCCFFCCLQLWGQKEDGPFCNAHEIVQLPAAVKVVHKHSSLLLRYLVFCKLLLFHLCCGIMDHKIFLPETWTSAYLMCTLNSAVWQNCTATPTRGGFWVLPTSVEICKCGRDDNQRS